MVGWFIYLFIFMKSVPLMMSGMVLYEVCGSAKTHIGQRLPSAGDSVPLLCDLISLPEWSIFSTKRSTDFHDIMSHQLLWFSIKAIQHKWLPLRDTKWTVSRKLWESPIWFHDTISGFHSHTDIDLGMKWWFLKSMKFSQCKCFSKTRTTDQGNDQGKHRTWVNKYSN